MHAVQAARQGRQQVDDVAVLRVGEPTDAPDVTPQRRQLGLAKRHLDAILDVIRQLRAAGCEELDAVVRCRVV